MSENKEANFDMAVFSQLAELHEILKGKNLMGQLIQNDGGQYSLNGEIVTSMNWSSTLKNLKKEKGLDKITWPKLFQILGKSASETPLGKKFIAYRLRQLFGVFSKADLAFCSAAHHAWHDDTGKFSPTKFDNWIKENKFEVQITNRKGEITEQFMPDGKTMANLIAAAETFAALVGYHSDKSVRDKENLPTEVLASFDV